MDQSKPDHDLERVIAGLAIPGVAIGYRRILPGDEDALLEEERRSIASSQTDRRRASGAARTVARQLLDRFGHVRCPIPRGADGEPLWPAGMTGSLSHDDEFAVAAVARAQGGAAIGIDIEPATPLPDDMIDLVVKPGELSKIAERRLAGRLLFAAKEAVYKAVFPLDRTFLEFQDIEVDLGKLRAFVPGGRMLSIRYGHSSHIIALAACHS
jgi:4'-phosphopantetheinyl transferase EntD